MPALITRFLQPYRTALQRRLLCWFDANRRDLPWRRTRDPYAIWVAEVMLQQTRVAAVLTHYAEFMRQFPTVKMLAKARLATVLAAWSGLGYYRRARGLHAAARVLMRNHGGHLPDIERELQELPGVGRYTAAAVASIAFDRPCAVVDGNVERVLARLTGTALSRAAAWDFAEWLLNRHRPGDFNQAMMELGATICLPAAPRCPSCPLQSWCVARHSPATLSRKKSVRRKRRIAYVLARSSRGVFLVRRERNASLMPGMWELPQDSTPPGCPPAVDVMTLRHSITNTDYQVTVVCGAAPPAANGRWIRVSRLPQLPLTGLTRKVLRRAGII